MVEVVVVVEMVLEETIREEHEKIKGEKRKTKDEDH